jgi:hypothetical protein
VAPVRRPWPHRSDHGAFKTATTRRGCLHSLPLPLSVSKRQNRAAIAAPTPTSSRVFSTAPPPTKSRLFLCLTALHLLDPPEALIEPEVSHIVTSARSREVTGAPPWRLTVAGVARASLRLPFLPQSLRLAAVKLVPSLDGTVRPHRRRHTATRPSPAAARGDEPLPLQFKPSCLHESKHRVTGNAWVHLVSRASSPPTSLSSPELAGRRPPCPLSLTTGTRMSVPRAGGSPSGPCARVMGLACSRAGPVSVEIYFI